MSFGEYDSAVNAQEKAFRYYEGYIYNDKGEITDVDRMVTYRNGAASITNMHKHTYGYNSDGSLSYESIGEATLTYSYDSFKRLNSLNVSYGNFSGSFEYTFSENGTYTSVRIESYKSTVNNQETSYTYSYDGSGNITKITYGDGTEIRYEYDKLGQLIREDNGQLNATYVYSYDNAGNITSKSTYSFVYFKETIGQ